MRIVVGNERAAPVSRGSNELDPHALYPAEFYADLQSCPVSREQFASTPRDPKGVGLGTARPRMTLVWLYCRYLIGMAG